MADFDDDLALLASELHRTSPLPVADFASEPRSLETWLAHLRAGGHTDLLLVAGAPPTTRGAADLAPLSDLPLDSADVERLVLPLLSDWHIAAFRRGVPVEAVCSVHGLGRFRVTLHQERNRAAACVHALPLEVPTLESMGATHDLRALEIGRAHV